MIDHHKIFYIGGTTGWALAAFDAEGYQIGDAEFGWTQRELIVWALRDLDHPVRVYTQNGHLKWTYAA